MVEQRVLLLLSFSFFFFFGDAKSNVFTVHLFCSGREVLEKAGGGKEIDSALSFVF